MADGVEDSGSCWVWGCGGSLLSFVPAPLFGGRLARPHLPCRDKGNALRLMTREQLRGLLRDEYVNVLPRVRVELSKPDVPNAPCDNPAVACELCRATPTLADLGLCYRCFFDREVDALLAKMRGLLTVGVELTKSYSNLLKPASLKACRTIASDAGTPSKPSMARARSSSKAALRLIPLALA